MRQVNEALAGYTKLASAAMFDRFQVNFIEVYQDLDPGLVRTKDAMAAGRKPEAFVNELGIHYGLSPMFAQSDSQNVRHINLRVAALVSFARETTGWVTGGDGSIYNATESDLFKVSPVSSKDGNQWGFGTGVAEGIRPGSDLNVDSNGQAKVFGINFKQIGSGVDIQDAVAVFAARLDINQTLAEVGADYESSAPRL